MTTDNLRHPPHSAEAEQSVLGAIMLDPSVYDEAFSRLDESDFFRRDHRIIWNAIGDVIEQGKSPDAVTLGEYIDSNHAEEIPRGYVIELVSNTPSAANVMSYVEIVKEKSTLRRLIEAGTDIVNYGYSPNGHDANEIYRKSLLAITAIEPAFSGTPPPTDLFGDYQPPTLRKEYLPPPLQEIVFRASAVKGSPPEVMALSMLVACAAACDDRFRVQPRFNEPGWTESARLWGVVVGDPSSKKTPAMKLAIAGLSAANNEMIGRYAKARAQYDHEMKIYTITEKKFQRAEANGEGAPERPAPPKAPRNERIITNDGTTEGITKLLADNERGLLYYTDELTSWLGGMGRYSANGSAADRAFWLECYQGGSKVVDRASAPPVSVPNLSVNVIGSIQPERIRSMASKMDDDGLLQRCMIAVIPNAERHPSDDQEPTDLIRAYNDMLMQIYHTRVETQSVVAMSSGADNVRREMDKWRVAIVASDGLPTMLRSAVAKYEGLFPRLCLTYHVISCAASRLHPTSTPITEATAKRVGQFIRQYLFANALTFYTAIMGNANPAFTLARRVADFLLANTPTRITRRDITHGCGMWRESPDWMQAQALATLEQSGWIFPAKTAGNVVKAWTVNPQVAVMYAKRAEEVRKRRAETTAVLAELRESKMAN